MKVIKYKQNLSLLLACSTLLVIGTCSLIKNGGINYTSIVCSASAVVPAVLVMYGLGWLIGAMIESSKTVVKEKDIGYTNALLQEIIKEEGLDGVEDLNNSDKINEEEETKTEEGEG